MLRDFVVLGLAITTQALAAQLPATATSEHPLRLSVTAELVLLDVSVKSAAGIPVSGLVKNDFRVYEDGKIQTISHFAKEDVPVTVGLLIDMSGSMRPKRLEVVTAALAFIEASNRSDEIFIVHFSDGASLGLPVNVPFSDNIPQLRSALWKGTPEGRTALNDAVVLSLKHLELGRRDRRTLILLSDGGDNSSVHVAEEVTRAVLESRATIYTIGIFDADDRDSNPGVLRRLAEISGGESFVNVPLAEVNGICQRIASDIRSRYTIGYVPLRSTEQGAWRKIKVSASTSDGHKLVVHTRTRYALPPKHPLVDQDGQSSR